MAFLEAQAEITEHLQADKAGQKAIDATVKFGVLCGKYQRQFPLSRS